MSSSTLVSNVIRLLTSLFGHSIHGVCLGMQAPLHPEMKASDRHLVQSHLVFGQANEDVLHLRVMIQHYLVCFTTNTGLLITAERCVRWQVVVVVNPHAASFDGPFLKEFH